MFSFDGGAHQSGGSFLKSHVEGIALLFTSLTSGRTCFSRATFETKVSNCLRLIFRLIHLSEESGLL